MNGEIRTLTQSEEIPLPISAETNAQIWMSIRASEANSFVGRTPIEQRIYEAASQRLLMDLMPMRITATEVTE